MEKEPEKRDTLQNIEREMQKTVVLLACRNGH